MSYEVADAVAVRSIADNSHVVEVYLGIEAVEQDSGELGSEGKDIGRLSKTREYGAHMGIGPSRVRR
jgi:hypothetical protein